MTIREIQHKYNLIRFIEAQGEVYPLALRELREGRKRSHWMWYVFPQLRGLGHSYNSEFYGISGTAEAAEYLKDPILGQRLREVSNAILNLPTDDAVEVFSGIDSLKLKSSMTLFDIASPHDIFARVLDKYFNGQRDKHTLIIRHRHLYRDQILSRMGFLCRKSSLDHRIKLRIFKRQNHF